MKLIENNISNEDIGQLIKDGSSGWLGIETYQLLVYKYIMDLHKNDCIPVINTLNNKKELLFLWITDDSFKNITKKIVNNKIYNFVDIKWFWNPEDKWLEKKDNIKNNNYGEIKKTFNSIKMCSKRFVPLFVRLNFSNISHANMIILDLKKKTAEHFEPHGFRTFVNLENDNYFKIYINDVLRIQLPLLFKDLGFKYISPIKTCPIKGLQSIQLDQNLDLYSIFKDKYGLLYLPNEGLCVLLSFILLDLRLSNEKYTTHQIMNKLLNIKNRKKIFLSHKNNDIYNKIYNIDEKNYKNNLGSLIYLYALIFSEKIFTKNISLFMKYLQKFENKYKMKGLVKYDEKEQINPFKMLNIYYNYNIKIELNNVDNPLDIYGFDLVKYMMKKIENTIFHELLNTSSIKLIQNNNKYIGDTYIKNDEIIKLEQELEIEKEYDYIYDIEDENNNKNVINILTIIKNLVIFGLMNYTNYL